MVGVALWHGVELMALVEVAILRTALRTAAALTFKGFFARDSDKLSLLSSTLMSRESWVTSLSEGDCEHGTNRCG
jgi:hypothetical protein